jgi:hypothetical protein
MEKRGWLRGMTWVEALITGAVLALLVAFLLPFSTRSSDSGTMRYCTNHQKAIALAAILYYQENNETLPTAESFWTDLQKTPGRVTVDTMRCTATRQLENGYVFNSRVAGKAMKAFEKDTATTFLTADGQHDTADGKPANVAFSLADIDTARHASIEGTWPFKHQGAPKFIACFLDGHAEVLKPEDAVGWFR